MIEEKRAHIVHLLIQQRYEEALSSLDDLVDGDSPDRELRMYHLLVVRILMLRWNLSHAATEQLSDSSTTSKGIISALDSVTRVSDSRKLIQSLGRVYQAAATTLAYRGTKRMIGTGAGFVFLITLLGFQMQEGSNAAIPVYSNVVASTTIPNPTTSALDATVDNPKRSGVSGDDGRPSLWSVETDAVRFFPLAYQTKASLPTEHVQHSTLSGTTSAKQVTTRFNADEFVGREKGEKVLTLESPIDLAAQESIGKTSPRKVLATYQSRRALSIRKSPRFAGPTVQEIDSGVSLNVLEFVGSWAKVEIEPAGTIGFVRKEFLIPVNENELSVSQTLSSLEEK